MKPEKAYTIGKGKLLFRAEGQSNFADLGNSPDFKFTVKSEKVDHPSSRSGFKTIDDSALIEQTAEGSFTLDDLMDENMKMFLMGNAIHSDVQTAGNVSARAVTAELDKWHDLEKLKISNVVVKAVAEAWDNPRITAITISFEEGSAGANDKIKDSGDGFVTAGLEEGQTLVVTGSTLNNGTYVALAVSEGEIEVANGSLSTEAYGESVTVAKQYNLGDRVIAGALCAVCTTAGVPDSSEPTWTGKAVGDIVEDNDAEWTIAKLTYIASSDYILDTEVGLFMPLAEGDIAASQALAIDFDHAAITTTRIEAATAQTIKGHLYFVGDPPKGKIRDVKGYVSLSPGGDFAVIGDSWQNIVFNMQFEQNAAYEGLYRMITRGTVTTS